MKVSPVTELLLIGCQPEPLAGYLKALGVLRLVSEQADPEVRGYWSGQGFVLVTALTQDDLCTYFLERYRPTPIVSPWNGGSGFSPKDNTAGMEAILSSGHERLAAYADVIRAAHRIGPKPDGVEKSEYLLQLRNELPDVALPWLDAATVLTDDGAAFPILLGTGGNDGRLDFSNNFMQRLSDALTLRPVKKNVADRPDGWLRTALFGEASAPLPEGAIGQFDPGSAGGSNSAPHGKGKSLVNPWDFVLMIEGALIFAAASVRKYGERKNSMAVPFTFRDSAAGYASAASENGRGEVWAPLWMSPATSRSVAALFSEWRRKSA